MIIINSVYDVEDIIVKQLESYFFNDIKISKIFPNFGNIRIDQIHPFALMLDSQINGRAEHTGLFPSITVVDTQSHKEQEANTPTIEEEGFFDKDNLQTIKEHRDIFIINDDDLETLDNYFKDNPTAEISTKVGVQRRKSNFVVEVWTDNKIVKNRIYDLCVNFLTLNGRFTLKKNYDIIIDENSVSGERSGNYNYDFGKILYAGMIRMDISYKISQYVLDASVLKVGSIDVELNHIKL